MAMLLVKPNPLIEPDMKLRPPSANAAVIFPTTAFAEKDGTFTNHAGRVQRIQKTIQTPPGWLSDGEIFPRILNLVESRQERFDIGHIWELMARDGTAFSRLRLDEIGPHGAALPATDG